MTLRVDAPEFTPSFKLPSGEDGECAWTYNTPISMTKGPKIQYSVEQLLSLRRIKTAPTFSPDWIRELEIDAEEIVMVSKPTRRNTPKQSKAKQSKETKAQLATERALLHKSNRRWTASQLNDSSDERAAKSITSLLNKLSSSNLARLVEQFVALVMQASILRRAVELVFDKAVSEPGFSMLYAKFTVAAAAIFAGRDTEGQELEQNFADVIQAKIDENEAELFIDFDKKRAIGISKFVGDLYNSKFVLPKIVHDRIFGMFSIIDQQRPDESHVELLCKFITTVGKSLETDDVDSVEQYFQVLELIMQNQAISSRARFMIMDLQELRTNCWSASFSKQPSKKGSETSDSTTMLASKTVSNTSDSTTFRGGSTSSSDTDAARAPPKQQLSAEQIDKKSTALLAEFFTGQDLSEALSCLKELNADDLTPDIIYKAITMGLDRKTIDRELVVQMLNASAEANIISMEHLEGGFMQVLELIEDLEIDIPHASSMVSAMLGGVMSKRFLPLSFLDQALPFFPPNVQPAVRIVDVLSAILKVTDDVTMRAVYLESAGKWNMRQYLQEEDVHGSDLLQAIC